MDTFQDITSLATIAFAYIILFILPFLYVTHRLFSEKGRIIKIYISMVLGLSCSIALVILLAVGNVYNPYTFLLCYLALIVSINVYYFYRSNWEALRWISSIRKSDINALKPKIISTIKSPIFILLTMAFILGFYTRLSYSFNSMLLPSIDPYGHLLVSKLLAKGTLHTSIGYYDGGVRGFHAVATTIHFYSQVDMYSILRFLGGFLGIISIGSIYCLISNIRDKLAGCISAIFYSGLIVIPQINVLIVRQTQSIPEVLAIMIMPITIFSMYEMVMAQKHRSFLGFIDKNSVLFFISALTLYAIHPYTLMMTLYILFILIAIGIIYQKRIRTIFVICLVGALIFVVSSYFIGKTFQLYIIDWGPVVQDLLEFKGSVIPSFSTWTIISISMLFIIYCYFIKDKNRRIAIIFVSTSCILLGFIESTGYLTISRLPLSRVMPFFAICATWLIGVGLSEIFHLINTGVFSSFLDKHRIFWLSNNTRLKVMACVILMVTGVFFIPTSPPALTPIGYEDPIDAMLSITDNYPLEDTTVYSEKIFLINRERTLIEPKGIHIELHDLLYESPINYTPQTTYTFIFIEKRPYPFRMIVNIGNYEAEYIMSQAKMWITEYELYNDKTSIYYETEIIVVYLIEVN
ncbi:MAG: hypothetical protein JSW00_13815 [Thermoplasmata archaeon]|nr:MAG: hypothetical protein JSW00_13815 [Thermoplasmata archaeon]